MAQRHVSKITTIAVSVFVFVLLFASVFSQMLPLPSITKENEKRIVDVMMGYAEGESSAAEMNTDLLLVKEGGDTVFNKI